MRIADKDDVSRRGLLPTGIGIAEKPLDCEGIEQAIAKIIVDVADVNHLRRQALRTPKFNEGLDALAKRRMCNDDVIGLVGGIPKRCRRCRHKRIDAPIRLAADNKISRMLRNVIFKQQMIRRTSTGNLSADKFVRDPAIAELIRIYLLFKEIRHAVLHGATATRFRVGIELQAVPLCIEIVPIVKFIPIQIEMIFAICRAVRVQCLNAQEILVWVNEQLLKIAGSDVRSLAFPLCNPAEDSSIEGESRFMQGDAAAGCTLELDAQRRIPINLQPRCCPWQRDGNILPTRVNMAGAECHPEIVVCQFGLNIGARQHIVMHVFFDTDAREKCLRRDEVRRARGYIAFCHA